MTPAEKKKLFQAIRHSVEDKALLHKQIADDYWLCKCLLVHPKRKLHCLCCDTEAIDGAVVYSAQALSVVSNAAGELIASIHDVRTHTSDGNLICDVDDLLEDINNPLRKLKSLLI